MGLDLALGAVVVLAAIRGWIRGFLLQAIRLGALVGSVYAAGSIREVARPYARQHLPTLEGELLDKLLWWTAVVVGSLVVSGVASAIVRGARRRNDHEAGRNDADHAAGFFLGLVKGLVVASFLAAGVERYSSQYLGEVPWAREQVDKSRGLQFSREYRPALRIWQSPPVRRFVAHVRASGLSPNEIRGEAGSATAGAASPHTAAPSASITPPLSLPGPVALDPSASTFLRDLDEALGIQRPANSR